MSCRARLALTVVALAHAAGPASSSALFPDCSDQEVVDTVLDTFFYTQQSSGNRVVLDGLSEVKELAPATPSVTGEWSQMRACSAKGSMSDGSQMNVWYQIVMPVVADSIGYRLNVCTERYDPVHADCERFKLPPQ
jgi:hypothetical protein